MFVNRKRDLVGDVGVESSTSLGCDKTLTDGGYVTPPREASFGEFLLSHAEGGFFINECLVLVDVSK